MKARLSFYLLIPALLSTLALTLACGGPDEPDTVPVTLPTDSIPQAERALSASELKAIEEFAMRQEEVGEEWESLRQEFDQWLAGLTSCQSGTVREHLQEFAIQFNAVTESARRLPRTSATSELADNLIAAAESEELAFRQLRDRWQPNNVSLFELIEKQRSEAARVQKSVEDQVRELEKKLEEAAAPDTRREVEDFSRVLHSIGHDWDEFHDDYASLLREVIALEDEEVLVHMGQLFKQVTALADRVDGLATANATGDMVKELQDTVQAEHKTFVDIYEKVIERAEMSPATNEESQPSDEEAGEEEPAEEEAGEEEPAEEEPSQSVRSILWSLDPAIKGARVVLKEITGDVEDFLDGSMEKDLEDIREFAADYQLLRVNWDAFHQGYNNWRRIEGGCDRSEVQRILGQFNIRAGEIAKQVRGLPQTGYLLPMYNLLVEAAEREENAMRALRNTWQPFTIDAYIAVERERDNADRLRREASLALEELRNR